MSKAEILIIPTGGTIGADVYDDPNNPPEHSIILDESPIPKALQAAGFDNYIIHEDHPELRKDSKHFTEEDLHALADIIQHCDYQHIIITHGTDCTAENSRALKKLLQDTGKHIIITGAMIPLSNGSHSDGFANLKFCVEQIEGMEPGVKVVAHGRFFEPDYLAKDYKNLRFYETKS